MKIKCTTENALRYYRERVTLLPRTRYALFFTKCHKTSCP